MKVMGRVQAAGAALGMLLLILDSPTALNSAREGMELCVTTVIPSLFPFFVLSSLLTGSLGGSFSPGWGRLLGLPQGCEGLFLTGILGGYPIGTAGIGEAVRQGRLNQEDGARLLAFCNNPGPAFIFGMAACMFDMSWAGWVLWAVQVIGALAVALLLPGRPGATIKNAKAPGVSLPAALKGAVSAMAVVCGWVVLFRVVIGFLDRWILWILPTEIRVVFCGLLELTNGCCMLNAIQSQGLRFIICSGLLSFGGLCVGMQTASVSQGVSLRWYLPGKLLHCLISTGLAAAVQELFPGNAGMKLPPIILPGLLIVAGILVFYRGKMKNRSGISRPLGV